MSEKKLNMVLKEQRESFQGFVVDELSKQDKKLEKKLVEQKEDFKNYTGALSERFERDFGVAMEAVTDLDKKVGSLDKKFDHMSERIDYVAELVARNTEDIEIIKSDTEFIKHGLKRKIDIEEFMALEKRVLKLEKAVTRN